MSDAPTTPVRRRLAWDAEDANEDTQEQPREEEEQREGDRQDSPGELEKLEVREKSKVDEVKEG